MAVKLTKNRIALNEFVTAPTVAPYNGAIRGLSSPDRIPQTYFGENQVRDNSMLDTVAGTPGTLPAHMAIAAAAGLTSSVSANEVIGGLTYAKINFDGTTAGAQIVINLDDSTQIAALTGQVWGLGVYVALGGSDTSKVTNANLILTQRTSGGASVASISGTSFSVSATPSRKLQLSTLTGGATVAFIQPQLRIVVQNAQTVHLTVYIAMHTVEQNIIRNQPVATYSYAQPAIWIPDTPIKVDPRRFGAIVDAVQATDGSWTGTDNTTAIYKAIATAARMNGICALPQGNMIFTDAIVDSNINCNHLRIEGRANTRLVMKTAGASAGLKAMLFTGTLATDGIGVAPTYYFTAAATAGSNVATFNTVALLFVGQWLQLNDRTTTVSTYDTLSAGLPVCYQGQTVQIDSINTGTKVVTFKQALEFNYAGSAVTPETLATNVQRYTSFPEDITLENFVIDYDVISPPVSTQYRIQFNSTGLHRVYNVDMLGPCSGLSIGSSLFSDVDTCSFIDFGVLAYGITTSNGSSFGKFRALTGNNIRHLFQSSTDADSIESANYIVSDSICTAARLAAFSGHPGTRNVKYNGCLSVGTAIYTPTPTLQPLGFQLRGRFMETNNCTSINMGTGAEMSFGHDNSMNGFISTSCDIGIRITRTDRAHITNTKVNNARTCALQLENHYTVTPFTPYPGMQVDMLVYGSAPSIFDVNYVMRTGGGSPQTVASLGDDWDINVKAVGRIATFGTTNVDAVTPNGAAFPDEYSFKQGTKTASFVCLAGRLLTYIVTPGASAIAVTIPSAALYKGNNSRLRFVKTGAGVGVVTLTAAAGNIDGAGSKVLATFLTIESDGTNWFTVG